MPQEKVFTSFAELADHARFQASKHKGREVHKLPPPAVLPEKKKYAKALAPGRLNRRKG